VYSNLALYSARPDLETTILTDVLCGFPKSLQADARIIDFPQIGLDRFVK
jgi:hypothetical protein